MKKLTLLLLIVLMFSCSSGIINNGSSKYENSIDLLNLNGSVKSLKTLKYNSETLMFGEYIPTDLREGNIFSFDKSGNMTQQITQYEPIVPLGGDGVDFLAATHRDIAEYYPDYAQQVMENWDSNLNFLNENIQTKKNFAKIEVTKCKTNESGYIIKCDAYDADNKLWYSDKFKYDSQGRLISINTYDENGELWGVEIRDYGKNNEYSAEDENGNILYNVKYKNGLKIVDRGANFVEKYNEKGDLSYEYDLPESYNYIYVDFDEQGNWIKRKVERAELDNLDPQKIAEFEIRIIEYY